ncbi:MAG TPA: AAA family ATPase, partial [Gemmata sp.]
MIITFKNYRCFPNNTTIDLSNFFTAFVGLNNAGKSSILRFAYEFRPTFRSIINRSNNIISMLGNGYAIQVAASDPDEIFTKPPRGELQIKIDVSNQPHWASSDLGEICIIIIIIIDSNSKMLRIALYCDSRRLNIDTDLHVTTIKKKEHKSDRFVLC